MRRFAPLMTALAFVLTACATAEPPAVVKVDKRIYVANESSNTVTVIDATTLTPI